MTKTPTNLIKQIDIKSLCQLRSFTTTKRQIHIKLIENISKIIDFKNQTKNKIDCMGTH